MHNSGYVYVLVNPSLQNCVKIGKTTRDPESRAVELSSATGVPTPFIVIYKAYFDDCHSVESYVHTLLETRGTRMSQNREFFSISPSSAIDVIIEAQKKFKGNQVSSDEDNESKYEDEIHKPWVSIFEEAENYHYGHGDYIEDKEKALSLYKTAAKLGSPEAFIAISEMYEFDDMFKDSVEWLKKGADNQHIACWIELAEIYDGQKMFYPEQYHSKENTLKCFRRFFSVSSATECPDRQIFSGLKTYMQIAKDNKSSNDLQVAKKFMEKFKEILKKDKYDPQGSKDKIEDLQRLSAQYSV